MAAPNSYWRKKQANEEDLIQALQVEKDALGTVEKLLDRKVHKEFTANINAKGLDDWTALHFACEFQTGKVIRYLLSKRAKVGAVSGMDRSPLHVACLHNNIEGVEALLEHGADVNF